MQKIGLCLSEADINDYLTGDIDREKRKKIESHLAACDACLEKTVFAYKTVREFNNGKGVTKMNSWKRNLWLVGAIIAFTLSFFAPRYFVQALVATILMGMKWIFDSVNARILIMIYDAWKKGGKDEASKILDNLTNRR